MARISVERAHGLGKEAAREKADMLAHLRAADALIPAGRVRQDQALVLADRASVGEKA